MEDIVVKEFQQLTLDDWMSIKSELEQEFRNAAAGFVRIGYLLRKVKESEGYKKDGYDTLTEWAKGEYNLSSTQVSRFMSINEKYSIGGYSKRLLPEYAKYDQSKLADMLQLSDESMEMVSPDMKRADIREIKAFERQAPKEEPVQEAKHQWIIEFMKAVDMKAIAESKAFRDGNLNRMISEVNPSGARTFRHKRTLVSMFPDRIMVREFPNLPERMEWQQFFDIVLQEMDRWEDENASRQQGVERAMEEPDRPGTNVPQQPTIPPMPKPQETVAEPQETVAEVPEQAAGEPEEHEDLVTRLQKQVEEQKAAAVHEAEPAEELPPAAVPAPGKPLAPAQKESPPSIVTNNVKTVPATEEEPEQVEIDEILPAPTAPDKLTELKDRFKEALTSLRVMADADHYVGMKGTIERLEQLRTRILAERNVHEEE